MGWVSLSDALSSLSSSACGSTGGCSDGGCSGGADASIPRIRRMKVLCAARTSPASSSSRPASSSSRLVNSSFSLSMMSRYDSFGAGTGAGSPQIFEYPTDFVGRGVSISSFYFRWSWLNCGLVNLFLTTMINSFGSTWAFQHS